MNEQNWNTGDRFKCSQHPELPHPHDDCPGPGVPDYQGRVTIAFLEQELIKANKSALYYRRELRKYENDTV